MRLRSTGFSCLLALFVAACARTPAAHAARGIRCDASADCNRDVTARSCAPMRLCVEGRCEVAADGGPASSGFYPCTDAH